jgi:hypothetical protein
MYHKKIISLILISATLFPAQAQKSQIPKPILSLHAADSFFFAGDWDNAIMMYEKMLADTSTNSIAWNRLGFSYYNVGKYREALNSYEKAEANHPPKPLQPFLYSRIARVYAFQKDEEKTFAYLDKAIDAGYGNTSELDTLKEFATFQNNEKFKAIKSKVLDNAFPCNNDPKKREFDFWTGDWDVFQTGTTVLVGHSVVQIASGGCMILENWTAVGVPHNGKSMNFVDTSGKWQQVWVGSEGSGMHHFINGEYRDSAMRFDFEQTNPQGKKLKGRFTFFNEGPNQVRQLNEVSADDGKTWSTNYDFTYIRKK